MVLGTSSAIFSMELSSWSFSSSSDKIFSDSVSCFYSWDLISYSCRDSSLLLTLGVNTLISSLISFYISWSIFGLGKENTDNPKSSWSFFTTFFLIKKDYPISG